MQRINPPASKDGGLEQQPKIRRRAYDYKEPELDFIQLKLEDYFGKQGR